MINLRARWMPEGVVAGAPRRRPAERERWQGYLLPASVIRRSGLTPGRFQPLYWLCKLAPALLLPALLHLAGAELRLATYAFIGLCASFAVDVWLLVRMRRRQRRIAYAVGYFLDMTVAFLRSGIVLDAAIGKAVTYGLPPRNPLRRELGIVLGEIRAGRSREEAFFALWTRTGVTELHSLATAFRVGFHLGTPIAAALERQSVLLRERQREGWRKRINAKAAQAIIPVVLLNFPMMGVIVFYPPLVEMAHLFVSF